MSNARVVSLVPSATETLLAWGLEPIGVSRFCEQGDRFVTYGGTKDPDVEAIVAASPDFVVMCDQENRREDADALSQSGIAVHAIHITRLSQVAPEMIRLAEALSLDPALGEACAPPLVEDTAQLRVFVPIWRKPWMTINAATYGGSFLKAAGFANVFSAHTDRYPSVDEKEIIDARPQAVLAPSEPYPFTERQRAELETFAPAHYVDGKDLFWWGVRTPGALQRFAALAVSLSSDSVDRTFR